ncbi:hypothetical protein [Micromonospora sp. NPDC051006]|uniref:hypothetical protein n=1 Tax=Micromonospora sp. NPDC051006 TaxID=3364283 RepID=UPI0037A0C6A5
MTRPPHPSRPESTHLDLRASCHNWLDRAVAVARRPRLTVTGQAPDRTAAILVSTLVLLSTNDLRREQRKVEAG